MIEQARLDASRGTATTATARYYARVVVPLMKKRGLDPEKYSVEIVTGEDGRPQLGALRRIDTRVPPIPRPARGARLRDLRVWTAAAGR
jgi:hypothetical protein